MSPSALRFGVLSLLVVGVARAQEDAPLPFEELAAVVLPSDDETAWKRLGWRASLWEGVIEGQTLGKPILLWAMNGHPLGCT